MEEIFDEWPDRDIVGEVVKDEDEIHVDEYVGKEETDEEDETYRAQAQKLDLDILIGEDWYEEEDEYNEDAPTTKEYVRDPNNVMVRGGSTCTDSKSSISPKHDAWTHTILPLSLVPLNSSWTRTSQARQSTHTTNMTAARPPARGSSPSSSSRSRPTSTATKIAGP